MGNTEHMNPDGSEEHDEGYGSDSVATSNSSSDTENAGQSSSNAASEVKDYGKTMVMDQAQLNADAEKARQVRRTTHVETDHEKTKHFKPYDRKFRSSLTQWLQNIRTTIDLRTTTDFSEPGKVDVNSLADIQATIDMEDKYASLVDNFTLKDEIASGGQGSICKALDKHCVRTVAIKTLHKKLQCSETARRLFLTEAQITAQLEHPSIIPIYGIYGDEENGLHLAMKLVRGRSLQEYLNAVCSRYDEAPYGYVRRCEADNLKKRLGYFINVVDAISYVHHKNVIHKDLKPENIMIGAFGETYVMDWGIAEKVDPEHTPKKPSGTLQYIAPEVINCEPYDTRSDIYLLGLILYDITFLKSAYESEDNAEAARIAKEADVAPYRHRYGCPVDSDLLYILDKALAVNPDDRYEKAEQLGKDIRAYLQGDVVSASPYQRIAKTFRFLRRHVKMLFILFIIMIALFFGTNFFFINKEYGASQRKLREKNLVSHLTATSLRKADEFAQLLDRCDRTLQQMAQGASLRIDLMDRHAPTPSTKVMSPYTRTPESAVYAPTYGFNHVSFDAVSYATQPDTPAEETSFYLAALNPMFETIKEKLPEFCMRYEVLQGMDRNDVIMYMTQHKLPAVVQVHIGLKNGMSLAYPFIGGQPQASDVRTQPWYTAAASASLGTVTVSEPRVVGRWCPRPVFTMSIPLFSGMKEFIGALAIDISEEFLSESLEMGRNRKIHNLRTIVVNRQGHILLDSNGKLQLNVDGTSPIYYSFPDREVFGRFSSLRNGSTMETQGNIRYLYVYSYLKLADWFYVERINFSKYADLQ